MASNCKHVQKSCKTGARDAIALLTVEVTRIYNGHKKGVRKKRNEIKITNLSFKNWWLALHLNYVLNWLSGEPFQHVFSFWL